MHGESDPTQQTKKLSFFGSMSSFGEEVSIDFSKSQIALQREALAIIEDQKQDHQEKILQEDFLDELPSQDMIEVSPGVCLPLRGSKETWAALLEG
jgi:hypothetical protein